MFVAIWVNWLRIRHLSAYALESDHYCRVASHWKTCSSLPIALSMKLHPLAFSPSALLKMMAVLSPGSSRMTEVYPFRIVGSKQFLPLELSRKMVFVVFDLILTAGNRHRQEANSLPLRQDHQLRVEIRQLVQMLPEDYSPSVGSRLPASNNECERA